MEKKWELIIDNDHYTQPHQTFPISQTGGKNRMGISLLGGSADALTKKERTAKGGNEASSIWKKKPLKRAIPATHISHRYLCSRKKQQGTDVGLAERAAFSAVTASSVARSCSSLGKPEEGRGGMVWKGEALGGAGNPSARSV